MLRSCALLASACCLFVAVSVAIFSGQAQAATPETQALLELLVSKGVISEADAQTLLGQVEARSAKVEEAPEPKTEKRPEWVNRLKWGGDIRLRYQGDFFDDENAVAGDLENPDSGTVNTTRDRNRMRYRARLSLSAAITDSWRAAFRLATGNENDPVSTNDTLGDTFNKDGIMFDQAYLEWKPTSSFTLTGGRVPNPWFSTDLVWDRDLNFEGLALSYNQALAPGFSVFATAGAFPLQEVELSTEDKWLYGAQVGMRAGSLKSVSSQLGVAYYLYDNIVGKPNDPAKDPSTTAYTAPGFMQKGNTLMDINATTGEITPALASEFKELNLLATVDIGYWDPVHVVLLGEYVKNLGFDQDEVSRRRGERVPVEDSGYMLGIALGHPSANELGKWNAFAFYKYLEADAVLDAFTDSDFHLGGTNAKGWVLGSEVGLAHNVWLTAKWQSADEIAGPPLAIDVLQFDVNAKF